MEKRKIGNMEVSPLGLGCMGITHASGAPMKPEDGIKVLEQAYDMGYTMFDTAECYTGINADGTIAYNEEIVGRALRPFRNHVVIATKCGVQHGENRLIMDSRPETIRRSVEKSLKRLQTDYIDLYYQHRIDPQVSPEEVAGVMEDLIREGKIRYWGISETNETYLRRAHAVCPVAAIQNRYSMMARWHENLFPVVEKLDIAYVAFSPMANGFLSGKYRPDFIFEKGTDYRSAMPQYTEEGFEKSKELMRLLENLAEEKQATPAQISLAWMLCKKPFMIPIPGSRKADQLKENIGAADIMLDKNEIEKIDKSLDQMEFLVFGGH